MRRIAVVTLALVMVTPQLVSAQAGELWGRLRVAWVAPDEQCEPIASTGSVLAVDSQPGLGLALEYGLTGSLSAELALSLSRHQLRARGGAADGSDAGFVWMAPPVLLLKYHLPLLGDFRPHVGVGVTYSVVEEYDLSDEMEAIGLRDIRFHGSAGAAAELGVDYYLGERWLATFDATYLKLATDAELRDAGADPFFVAEMDFDPWVASLGVGHRF